mmetsp:Transcript_25278/g.54939  ORF Transcript_25278/g.54939 Transcript_25278/m.54939 type:complete len:286 (-) Transcript_25278:1015-1872(-)|eukprot:CAMPEP_0202891120 /NCGR_PEP_ID=MMETSP1392-20130828/1280_1 /ASSEMBLY_ACC=CAM_ASM_000868 /TAXON_ID=225041 /ORGANISM="Chlamydomonas chlamydogama, Strain SAG 11-48b" /LENGTH=285 /DNA_ID=CAMNT_0049574799 /DNA_START=27 /DNA_END=884 /DNA_ORIENTATION=+
MAHLQATQISLCSARCTVGVTVPPLRPGVAATCRRRTPFTAGSNARSAVLVKAAETETKPIEGLNRDYCDDFVCTSSPAIEQTVRSFARDLERCRYTTSLFVKNVTYSDGFRQFSDSSRYARQRWLSETVQKPAVTVMKMQMLDKGTAQINWRLTGSVGAGPVDVSFTSTIEMNLLTGKITSHKESWDLTKCAAPVAAMLTANRMAWAAKQASQDASEGLSKVADSISSTLGSMDEDTSVYQNPSDPTKFFQQNNNQQQNDMITFCMIVAALYVVYKGFSVVVQL